MKPRRADKGAITKKAAVVDYSMQMGVEILKITVCLYGYTSLGDSLFMQDSGF